MRRLEPNPEYNATSLAADANIVGAESAFSLFDSQLLIDSAYYVGTNDCYLLYLMILGSVELIEMRLGKRLKSA